jgi:RHS repeat-associated protein
MVSVRSSPEKERDIETGLDYFLARYYSSTLGRFTSPDEFTGGPDELFTLASVISRHDYMPFGEELGAGIGGRTTAMGFPGTSDGLRQKFTSKERDVETGLDYFGARYFASTQGRFTSADPLYIEMGRLGDPQQFNLYAYTRNNPLRFTDPLGLDIEVTGTEQEAYRKRLQQNVSFQTQINSQTNKVQIVDTNGNVLDKKQLKALEKTLKGAEKELFKAITDEKHHITINAMDGAKDPNVFFGSSDGNHTGTHTIAFGQAALLDDAKNAGGMTSAQLVGHETLEAYAESKGSSLGDAHNYANGYFGGLDPQPKSATYGLQGGMVVQLTGNFSVHGSSTTERITMRFVTPIPQQDF